MLKQNRRVNCPQNRQSVQHNNIYAGETRHLVFCATEYQFSRSMAYLSHIGYRYVGHRKKIVK